MTTPFFVSDKAPRLIVIMIFYVIENDAYYCNNFNETKIMFKYLAWSKH